MCFKVLKVDAKIFFSCHNSQDHHYFAGRKKSSLAIMVVSFKILFLNYIIVILFKLGAACEMNFKVL